MAEDLILVERMLRAFMRSTSVKENTLHKRLGTGAERFEQSILPRLLNAGVLAEVGVPVSGQPRRLRLAATLERVTDAIQKCDGDFEEFLRLARDR